MITNYSDHITTDKEDQKELVELYNKWYKDTMFLSSWPASNKYWDEMEEYCKSHKDITVQFWVDLKHDLGTVGHFTYMLQKILPGVLEPQGYIPLNIFEQTWLGTLCAKYEYFKGELTPDEPERWNKFWEEFKIIDWYTDLDNPEHFCPWSKNYNIKITTVNGVPVEELNKDLNDTFTMKFKSDFWE